MILLHCYGRNIQNKKRKEKSIELCMNIEHKKGSELEVGVLHG